MVAQFEKNKINDLLTNINKLMEYYQELKCDKDLEDLYSDDNFKEENRKLAQNTYLYYNHLLKNEIEDNVDKASSLDDSSDEDNFLDEGDEEDEIGDIEDN